jgi:anti-sigma factor RsiW
VPDAGCLVLGDAVRSLAEHGVRIQIEGSSASWIWDSEKAMVLHGRAGSRHHTVRTTGTRPSASVPGDDLCCGVEEHKQWGTNDSGFKPGGSAC